MNLNVEQNESSSSVIETINNRRIFSLLTERSILSYRLHNDGHIEQLNSTNVFSNVVSADRFMANNILAARGNDNLRLELWNVDFDGVINLIAETDPQQETVNRIRITNLRNPVYLLGVKTIEGELRLIPWGVST